VRAQTRTKVADRAAARQRRAERMADAKLNRSQLRAMEVRAAETLAPDARPAVDAGVEEGGGAAVSLPRRTAAVTRRAIARPVALTKEQEYRFIRSDLHRLGITAGALFVLMIVLLFVVD
jgi:hypothetical protein